MRLDPTIEAVYTSLGKPANIHRAIQQLLEARLADFSLSTYTHDNQKEFNLSQTRKNTLFEKLLGFRHVGPQVINRGTSLPHISL